MRGALSNLGYCVTGDHNDNDDAPMQLVFSAYHVSTVALGVLDTFIIYSLLNYVLDNTIIPFLLMSKLRLQELNHLIAIIQSSLVMQSPNIFIMARTHTDLPDSVLHHRCLNQESI